MSTLMRLDNQRCDANCYMAEHKKCECCCGGMNHGKGLQRAIENTDNYKKSLDKQGIDWHLGFDFTRKPIQMPLF